ncbi:MAG: glycosyltransferase family 2 protein [Bacteroidales bacterium]|nr:glycosyltransferase family 2 protein [Bacteroidales bacterium]
MLKTAIVILNWNGRSFLERFLPSVISNSNGNGFAVYIADNGSTDDSLPWLEKNHPLVKIIRFDRNYGFAQGYSLALQQIEAEYFVLLNSDVEVTPHWVSPIIKLMDNDKSIAACMPKIKSFQDKELFEYAGAAGGFIDRYGYPFCRGRILNVIEKDQGQYEEISEIFWASGACMFLRASSYFEAGGLDAGFFAHMEEIDLCWRLKRLGYKVMYSPEAAVYHVGGGTLPNNTTPKIYLNYRNNLYLLFKNLAPEKLFTTLFIRLFLDGISSCLYIAQGKFSFCWSVLRAHTSFYLNIRKLYRKRKNFKRIEKVRHPSGIFRKSILYRFFIKKERHFHQFEF